MIRPSRLLLLAAAVPAAAQETAPAAPATPDGIAEVRDPRGPVSAEALGRGEIDVPGEPVHDDEFRIHGNLGRLEYQSNEGEAKYVWDGFAYAGGDYDRLWIESEGEGLFDGELEAGDVQVLYSRAITPYWNAQAGIRHDFSEPELWYGVVALKGLNVYWSEIAADAYLSEDGDVSGAFEIEYDALLTQRLIAQPRFEMNLQAQDVPDLGLGAGITSVEAGLRVRYEIVREFAPYVGVSWARRVGETAAMQGPGEDTGAVSFVAGIRIWF